LEPVVTLHHFTNPAWFAQRGGWLCHDSPQLFARYVTYVAEHLGTEVKYWLTINEPTVYVLKGYVEGEWPPCLKAAWFKAARVFRNLACAHAVAYRALHRSHQDILVGLAHSAPLIVPCDPARKRDRLAATLRDLLWNRAFFALIRKYGWRAGRNLDFIGLNYYTRTIIRSTGWGPGALVGRACRLPHHNDRGPLSDTGWEVYPPGLRVILERFAQFHLPILITENGVATDDEVLRRQFIMQHLVSLAEALEAGVNVLGYFYWTLMDNFEWTLGTTAHFGLAAVDLHTQQRVPRPCVSDFVRVCRENRLALGVYKTRREAPELQP
jgi:beta-glucosidase